MSLSNIVLVAFFLETPENRLRQLASHDPRYSASELREEEVRTGEQTERGECREADTGQRRRGGRDVQTDEQEHH